MDNWFGTFIEVVGAILALLILIGGAFALVRGSFNKARADKLREDLDDADRRLGVTEHDLQLEKGKTATLEAKVEGQEREIAMLREMVTQRAAVENLGATMSEMLTELRTHHQVALDHWRKTEERYDA